MQRVYSCLAKRCSLPRVRCGLASPFRMFSSADLFNPTEGHHMLRNMMNEFSLNEVAPQAEEFDHKSCLNMSLFLKLAELGAMGVTIPAEDGGAGMDAVAAVIIHHELSKYDPGFCLAYLAHSMLFVNNFYHAASPEQRKRYLPQVISGECVAGIAMTEPDHGTDVLGMTTSAVKRGDEYVLNGSKTFITNGPEGGLFLVYAKVNGKITSFVVEQDFPGFSSGKHIDKIGCRGSSTCELFFEDCRVPAANLLGEEGQGLVHMMRNLEIERVTLAAMGLGIADRCVDVMLDYGNTRQAFGKNLTHFGQIQKYIGESYAETLAAKCLTYHVASHIHPDNNNRVGSDASKLFSAPVSKRVADNAMQVLGGMGYCREGTVERLWRDAKLLEIGGGTLESHQKNITKDLSKAIRQHGTVSRF